MRAVGIVIVLVGVLAFLSVSCSKEDATQHGTETQNQARGAAQTWKDGDVAVKVNGKPITAQQVAQEEARLTQQFLGNVSPEQIEAMRSGIRKQAVLNLVNRALLEEEVVREKIKIPKDEVEGRIDEVRKSLGSEEALAARLHGIGMTMEEFREKAESGLKIEALLEKKSSSVEPPTEEEIKAFYESDKQRFESPERVRASHILIAFTEADTEADRAEKKRRALELLERIKGGADFAEIASQYSDGPSKSRGGDLGFFERGRMVKPFEDAAFALRVGEVSDVVETRFGYHIVKVTDREKARTIPFEEAKEDIARYLAGEKKIKVMDDYAAQLRSAATIEYADSSYVLDLP